MKDVPHSFTQGYDMNLSTIWHQLDSDDRATIINILKRSDHDYAINKDLLDNQGKLIFLDAHEIMRELQRYLVDDATYHYGGKYKRIKRIVQLIIDQSLPYGHYEE